MWTRSAAAAPAIPPAMKSWMEGTSTVNAINKKAAKEAEETRPQPCRVTCTTGQQLIRGSSVHFDDGGMLITCRNPLTVNSKVYLKLRFPDLKEPLELEGVVVWSNIYGPDDMITPRGMAVKFDNLDSDISRILAEFSRRYEVYGDQYRCYYS